MNKKDKEIKKLIEENILSTPLSEYERIQKSMTHEDIFKMMHEDLLGDVNRFHNKFGFKKNEKVGIPDNPELVNFRTSFLMEELAEFTQAITKKDDAGALDALVDIVYIALGTAWLYNLPFEKAWKEVQTANMKKVRAKSKSKKRGTAFDVIKPKGWKAPNIDQIVEEEKEQNEDINNGV